MMKSIFLIDCNNLQKRKGAAYIEITKNILSAIKAERLYRVDVDFIISEKYFSEI